MTDAKADRRAAALRANLSKRKAQARAIVSPDAAPPVAAPTDQEPPR
ncbi:hypothetical protein GGQ80_000311 [Sphingomonas jinjuensis]|uniref:Uncharacterized protein n=1 Tax=Sphingomonas jinjuensis TaxID=535907 RepID=A0A840FGG6_9SPHN|nr:hypothetical protein [Sphingomonas jinjuensis]MBB4152435.1 hypothetical protein [Sphingomonas jinjuensis]